MTSSGKVFTWGNTENGRLGLGGDVDSDPHPTPTQITTFTTLVGPQEQITSIALGSGHSAALTSTGRVFIWGDNANGQLGLGDYADRNSPTEVISLNDGDKITSIALGASHSAALTLSGNVFTWGNNEFGQLNLGSDVDSVPTPTQITTFTTLVGPQEQITSIALGTYHSAALTSTGRVFIWGDNDFGQLGLGDHTNRTSPTEVISLNIGDKITSIALGGNHSAALTLSGKVFTWGNNTGVRSRITAGQLGRNLHEGEYSSPNPDQIIGNYGKAVIKFSSDSTLFVESYDTSDNYTEGKWQIYDEIHESWIDLISFQPSQTPPSNYEILLKDYRVTSSYRFLITYTSTIPDALECHISSNILTHRPSSPKSSESLPLSQSSASIFASPTVRRVIAVAVAAALLIAMIYYLMYLR